MRYISNVAIILGIIFFGFMMMSMTYNVVGLPLESLAMSFLFFCGSLACFVVCALFQ